MERYAALRSSALIKCQSSNSASRVYAALLTDGPLNLSDASVSKADEMLLEGGQARVRANKHTRPPDTVPTRRQTHIGDKKQYSRLNFSLSLVNSLLKAFVTALCTKAPSKCQPSSQLNNTEELRKKNT